jgi:Flp pilus assembly protein TadG
MCTWRWIDREVRSRRQAGQNVVELALLITFLLTMTLGMIDFGRIFYANIGITNAAREGARRATLLASCTGANLTAIQDRVRAEQPALGITNSMITVDCSQANRRTVSIVYSVQLASPFLDPLVGDGTGNVVLRTWSTMPTMPP